MPADIFSAIFILFTEEATAQHKHIVTEVCVCVSCSPRLQGLLLEVGVGPVGLDEGPGLLLDSAGQRELDLGVVGLGEERPAALAGDHSLAADDLDGVSASPTINWYFITFALEIRIETGNNKNKS